MNPQGTCSRAVSITIISCNLPTITKTDEAADLFNHGFICSQAALSVLHEERKALGRLVFDQEYMCQRNEPKTSVFRRETIERAFKDRPGWDVPDFLNPSWELEKNR